MPVITGIEASRGAVRVYIDGVAALRVPKSHFEKLPLREGEEIDLDAYTDRLASIQLGDAWESALTLLERSDRSAKSLGDALRRKGYAAPAVDAVLERLRESGLIDDARYAQRMAELQSKGPVGLYAFKRRLRAKGISDDDAEEALAHFDEDQQRDACLAAARKLFHKYEALPPREGKAKLSQALARRGFPWDAVESALNQLFE